MKILVTGATGFVGHKLCEVLKRQGHQVVALSRDGQAAKQRVPALDEAYSWEPTAQPAPGEAFAGVDGVVHLLGETVSGRWTSAKKAAIRDSRVMGTRNLVHAIERLESKPRVLVSSSAVGYYGDRGEEELTEESAPGNDFLARTSQEWESAAVAAEAFGVRVVRVRGAVVIGPGGGALDAMLLPFKLGAGGPLGSGRQWWPWIHRQDLINLTIQLLEGDFSGPINGTAPPVRQKDFAKALGRALKRPAFMPAPAFAMRIVLGEFSSELLSSKRVLPKAAEEMGFTFEYPEVEGALRQAVGK